MAILLTLGYYSKIKQEKKPMLNTIDFEVTLKAKKAPLANEQSELLHQILKPKTTKKIIYINFWAVWCTPCLEEIPRLLEAVKNNPDIQFYFVNMDSNEKSILSASEFIKSHEPPQNAFFVYDQQKKIKEIFNMNALPAHLITDQNYLIWSFFIGDINTSEEQFTTLLQQLNLFLKNGTNL